MSSYTLEPVGFIRSTLKRREEGSRQGAEGAPDAWLEIDRNLPTHCWAWKLVTS